MIDSKPSFVCFELTKGNIKIKSLTGLLKELKSGFHAFYTHEALISGIQSTAGGSSAELKTIFEQAPSQPVLKGLFKTVTALLNKNALKPLRTLSLTDDTSASELLDSAGVISPLILINGLGTVTKAETIQTFFQALRERLSEGIRFKQAIGYSLNQAASWDLFLEREKFSGIIPGAHDYHEYLLWEGSGLHEDKNWNLANDSDKNKQAWAGSSWLSEKFSSYSSSEPLPWPSTEFGSWVSPANEHLIRSLSSLTHFYKGGEHRLYNLEQNNNFVRSLCEFLPKHKSLRTGEWILSNMNGEKGGPVCWHGLLDDGLQLRKRHLLLDGWLSLWPYQEENQTILYLQPSSLALLFWAAQRVSMPHTDTPEDFLANYDWGGDQHWFGGHWKNQ